MFIFPIHLLHGLRYEARMIVARAVVLLLASSFVACTPHEGGRSPIPKDQRPDLTPDTADTAAEADTDDTSSDTDTPDTDDTSPDTDTRDTAPDSGDVDLSEACHPDVADWPAEWAAWEDAVVAEVNAVRARGADCGDRGPYAAAGPVSMQDQLRCAARYHSRWMRDTDTFEHDSPGGDLGEDPWERIDATGYAGSPTGENIGAGYSSPAAVVAGWVESDGHCANLMNASATQIGVGYAAGGSWNHWWTQVFGR